MILLMVCLHWNNKVFDNYSISTTDRAYFYNAITFINELKDPYEITSAQMISLHPGLLAVKWCDKYKIDRRTK